MLERQTIKRGVKLFFIIVVGTLLVVSCRIFYDRNYSEAAIEQHVYKIYDELQTATGQGEDRLPLKIIHSDVINAYNSGSEVVIFTGLIKFSNNWDEIAMMLGHEIAHGMLHHLKELRTTDASKISVLESNADKMGAFYAMKAGYDVCRGREYLKRFYDLMGDQLEERHPPFSYRYAQLNINCD